MTVRNLTQIPCYLKPTQYTKLKAMSKRTRVPMQAYLREAVDLLLSRYTTVNVVIKRSPQKPIRVDVIKQAKRSATG